MPKYEENAIATIRRLRGDAEIVLENLDLLLFGVSKQMVLDDEVGYYLPIDVYYQWV